MSALPNEPIQQQPKVPQGRPRDLLREYVRVTLFKISVVGSDVADGAR